MRKIIDLILSGKLNEAREMLEEEFEKRIVESLEEKKFEVASEFVSEANIMKMGRSKLIRVRIRGGKVQRRKKLSAVPGYTYRNGRLVRMSTMERRRRKLGARKAKLKRRGKMAQILRKRRISLRKRKALGVR